MTLHLWESTPLLMPDMPHVAASGSSAGPIIVPPDALDDARKTGLVAMPNSPMGEVHPLHPAVQQPLPSIEGGWGTIMADPPWKFRSWVANANYTSDRSTERHYRTMTLDEIKAMPIREIAAADAHLFLWITGPFMAAGVHVAIMKAWGFKPSSSGFVWMKLKRSSGKAQFQMITLSELQKYLHVGMGHTTRKNVEFCILGRRGNARRLSKSVQEAIIAPVREHSRKPDEAYERAQDYAAGPYLELFSREEREGWETWGNETGKF